MRTVRNINEKTRHQCLCGTWSAHLNAFGGNGDLHICSELNCHEQANVGAHVQFEGDSTWYVIGLCLKHNTKENGKFQIKPTAKMAPASVSQTCELKLASNG